MSAAVLAEVAAGHDVFGLREDDDGQVEHVEEEEESVVLSFVFGFDFAGCFSSSICFIILFNSYGIKTFDFFISTES